MINGIRQDENAGLAGCSRLALYRQSYLLTDS